MRMQIFLEINERFVQIKNSLLSVRKQQVQQQLFHKSKVTLPLCCLKPPCAVTQTSAACCFVKTFEKCRDN